MSEDFIFSVTLDDHVELHDTTSATGSLARRAYERPLHFAIRRGQVKQVRDLLAAGADVNPVSWPGRTPLEVSLYDPKFSIVKTLLRYNANPNVKDEFAVTPLHTAAYFVNDPGLVDLLIFHGAKVGDVNEVLNNLYSLATEEQGDARSRYMESAHLIEYSLWNVIRRERSLKHYEDQHGMTTRVIKFEFED